MKRKNLRYIGAVYSIIISCVYVIYSLINFVITHNTLDIQISILFLIYLAFLIFFSIRVYRLPYPGLNLAVVMLLFLLPVLEAIISIMPTDGTSQILLGDRVMPFVFMFIFGSGFAIYYASLKVKN